MKLNPFSKKPTAYYDKVKAEYDQLSSAGITEILAMNHAWARNSLNWNRELNRYRNVSIDVA